MNSQEAIALLRNLENSLDSYCGLNEEGKTAFRMAIEALSCSEIPNNSDTISRQAAIDALKSRKTAEQSNAGIMRNAVVDFCIGIVKKLPSVQPETAKRIVGKSRDGMTLWYQCDTCNEPVDAQDDYCRGCGRRLIDETD